MQLSPFFNCQLLCFSIYYANLSRKVIFTLYILFGDLVYNLQIGKKKKNKQVSIIFFIMYILWTNVKTSIYETELLQKVKHGFMNAGSKSYHINILIDYMLLS